MNTTLVICHNINGNIFNSQRHSGGGDVNCDWMQIEVPVSMMAACLSPLVFEIMCINGSTSASALL